MKNFVQNGDYLTVTAPRTVSAGDGVLIGTGLFGIAVNDATSGATDLVICREGVFDIAKAAGAISAGTRVFWDDTAHNITTTATSNQNVGICVAAAASGDATCRVLLEPQPAVGA